MSYDIFACFSELFRQHSSLQGTLFIWNWNIFCWPRHFLWCA